MLVQGILLVLVIAAASVGPGWRGPLRLVSTAVGGLLLVAGGVLAARGVVDLGPARTPLPYPRDGATLVKSGAYGLVRHPIYGGLAVAALGWALVWASLPGLVLAPILLFWLDLKSRREEAWLEARFEGYAAYRAKTRRLIPFVY